MQHLVDFIGKSFMEHMYRKSLLIYLYLYFATKKPLTIFHFKNYVNAKVYKANVHKCM